MTIIKCKMCGGDIQRAGDQAYGTCDSCGSTMTFPKVSDEQRANLFNRANHFRRQGEFDKAVAAYESILNQDDTDSEAHWGVVLSRYGIEYVEDPASHERVPTCHRVQMDSVLNDADYLAALEHAPDGYSRSLYEEEAKRIADIQKSILALSAQEKPYDVFICYKETTDGGTRTPDSALAQEVYYQLAQEGYKVFFSRITLEDKLGRQYEPYIFAALNSAKVMVVIGTQAEYFNAVWVRNEWSRFLTLMKKDRSKLLIPCYKGMDAYDLPEALSMLQSQDMGKIGFIQDLVRGIKKVVDAGKAKPGAEAASKPTETVAVPGVQSLLTRAQLFLEDGDFKSAAEYADKVLDIDPKYAPAYIVRLQAALSLKSENELGNATTSLEQYGDFQKAVRFADSRLKPVYLGYNQRILDRLEEERREGVYQTANKRYREASDEAGYRQAAGTFRSIPGYKDADERALASQAKAEEARLAKLKHEEEERAERSRREAEQAAQAERERIADEKRRAKNKRMAMVITLLVLAAAGIVLLLTQVVIPRGNYQKAMDLLNSKQYDQAAAAFEALSGYSDSKRMVQESVYRKAKALQVNGRFDEAITLFGGLGGYQDSVSILNQVKADKLFVAKDYMGAYLIYALLEPAYRTHEADYARMYQDAMYHLNNKNYDQAAAAFLSLGAYSDSAEKARQSIYQKGTDLLANKQYDQAAAAFLSLGAYSDSAEKAQQSIYQKGTDLLANKNYDQAAAAFLSLGAYSDSAEMVKESAYRKGKALAASQRYAEAAAILIGIKDYKDTASLLAGNAGLSSAAAAAVLERKFTVGNIVTFGRYEQDNSTANGKEPIRWRVLKREGQKALLLSEKNLDQEPYNTAYTSVTWETCTLRAWLNGTFLTSAFTPAEQGAILTTTVKNEDNPQYNTDGGNSTQDRVFLLSIEEAESLFQSDADRKAGNTPYAKAQGAYDNGGFGRWWLCSPGFDQSYAAYVSTGGSVIRIGNFVSNDYNAVRPACWLDLTSGIVTSEAP